jgi:chromosomal replication initiator protein
MKASEIVTAVCNEFSVKRADLMKSCRLSEVVEARQVAFYLIRSVLRLSYRLIGSELDRDHTTVGFGCRATVRRLRTDVMFNMRVNSLKSGLLNKVKKPVNKKSRNQPGKKKR